MQIAVTLKNINKDFPVGKRMIRLLHEINTEIPMGKLTMLIGPSGCGKTTMISILSGILSTTTGEVDVMGVKITAISDYEKVIFRRKNIGFIFQQYHLLPALTAAENSAMPLIAAGVKEEEAIAKACEILEKIGMKEEIGKTPRQLSGGQQQRVAIARSLVHKPPLIICDEPTAALDAKTGHQVMDILRNAANDQNRAVLVVSHDNRIFDFADYILEMSDGRIIGSHDAKEFLKKEKLQ